MAKVYVTTREGQRIEIDAPDGESLMEGLRRAGIDEVLAICGGNLSCATCHVYVESDHFHRLDPITAEEGELLESTGVRRETSRLSCQIELRTALSGLEVRIAPEP